MGTRRTTLLFYLCLPLLAASLAMFALYRYRAIDRAPEVLFAAGGVFGFLYLLVASAWAYRECVRNNYSLWLSPLSGALAGLILGVGLEMVLLQGHVGEGTGVNAALAAGTIVSCLVCSRTVFQESGMDRGRSARYRRFV